MDTELVEFLNTLGEAERAGGRVLHELEQEAASLELKELLRKTAHDEGYYAGQIGLHIRRMGGEASTAMGDFVEKVRALGDQEQDRAAQSRPALGDSEDRRAAPIAWGRETTRLPPGDGQGPLHEHPGGG
jgi:hypothetical protein